ncbi:MAG: type II toxin-antitoxin system Phd/YefM family antitoxin [Armatimonadetes bacterium]|nr:type II toxin-antitoxin system Phd/YefM family antitoxin [Armatimonadota bacterium]
MATTVGVKEAHQRLARLVRAAEEGQQVVITRDGTPAAVLLGAREFNSLMATLEEMADPGALRALRDARADARSGRIYSYEDVFGHPPLRVSRGRLRLAPKSR